MGFAEFAALVGPPTEPSLPVDWDAVESWLKLRLPSDYKEVASVYGPLIIPKWARVYTPLSNGEWWDWDYTDWLKETRQNCSSAVRVDVPAELPAFHPARGGLLAWGDYSPGSLFWDTSVSANPDEWPTVLYCREFPYVGNSPFHRYDMSMTEFLVAAIQTGIDPGTRWGFGPLEPKVERPRFQADPRPWTPPVRRRATKLEVARRAALRKGNGLEALTVLVPPPEHPQLGGVSWDEVAEQLGTSLPSEYRELIDRYGAGEWRGWLDVFGRDDLVEKVEMLTGIYRELRERFPQSESLAVWPEPGGFLPFATSIDGDELGWLTLGDPQAWPVFLVPRDGEPGRRWRTSLVDGLLRWTRGYAPPGMPEPDPLDDLLELASFAPTGETGS